MKGAPIIEVAFAFLLLLVVSFPVVRLTRDVAVEERPGVELSKDSAEHDQHVEDLEGLVLFRSSHPLAEVLLVQGNRECARMLEEDQGTLEAEADIAFSVEHGAADFRVAVRWQEPVAEQAYCELTIEPDGYEARKLGVWGQGVVVDVQEVRWPHEH